MDGHTTVYIYIYNVYMYTNILMFYIPLTWNISQQAFYGIFQLYHDIHTFYYIKSHVWWFNHNVFFSQAFCCAEFHVGCVVTAPAPAPAAMPYDCHAGYSNWRLVTLGKCQDFFQQILGKFERPKKTYRWLLGVQIIPALGNINDVFSRCSLRYRTVCSLGTAEPLVWYIRSSLRYAALSFPETDVHLLVTCFFFWIVG